MRAESYGLETYSPYQDLDLEDAKIFDGGDLELCFGDTNLALDAITEYTEKVMESIWLLWGQCEALQSIILICI